MPEVNMSNGFYVFHSSFMFLAHSLKMWFVSNAFDILLVLKLPQLAAEIFQSLIPTLMMEIVPLERHKKDSR